MEFDAFHHWSMLRPLFVFILALPLLIAALWLGARQDRRKKNASQKLASSAVNSAANVAAANIDARSSGDSKRHEPATTLPRGVGEESLEQPAAIEAACSAVKIPREWDGGPLRPNYNRQSILCGGRSGGALR